MPLTESEAPAEVRMLATLWPQIPTSIGARADLKDGTGLCIASTRFGIGVLEMLGVKCRALPCSLIVRNAFADQLCNQGVPMAKWPSMAWSLGVMANDKPVNGLWDAHLCVEWRSKRGRSGILDLDLPRYSKPEYGIRLLATGVSWPDKNRKTIECESAEGTYVRWDAARHLTGYRRSIEWAINPDREELAAAADVITKTLRETN